MDWQDKNDLHSFRPLIKFRVCYYNPSRSSLFGVTYGKKGGELLIATIFTTKLCI